MATGKSIRKDTFHTVADAVLKGAADTSLAKFAAPDLASGLLDKKDTRYVYAFQNFFHPRVGHLRRLINKGGLEALFDPHVLKAMENPNHFTDHYTPLANFMQIRIESEPAGIALDPNSPYALYNWELLYHAPLMIAVHLSKTQRFAEADKWFRFILDRKGTGKNDPAPDRFWRFPAFRTGGAPIGIDEQIRLLAEEEDQLTSAESEARLGLLNALGALRETPFNPFAAARAFNTRSFQWLVAFKCLDNYIAWGDHYFSQGNSLETLDLSRQRYVWAANLLGPRPERITSPVRRRALSYRELAQAGMDELGNALVALETSLPFNVLGAPSGDGGGDGPMIGMGRTLYFCVPPNDKMLHYWDTVADRLFKLRHCMNIMGVVQPLSLFDPPLDPGMLVGAAGAGIDVASIVAGLHQPPSPVRARQLLDRAIALASELRTVAGALQTALEREDAEALARLRQDQEHEVLTRTRETRFMAWKQAEAATETLQRARDTARLRYVYAARQVGFEVDAEAAPEVLALRRAPMTAEGFAEAHEALVEAYDGVIPAPAMEALTLAEGQSAAQESGNQGAGSLFLIPTEDAELNKHLPGARDFALAASVIEIAAPFLALVPNFDVNLHYWGLGASTNIFGGDKMAMAANLAAQIMRTLSGWERDQAGIAGKTSSFERRADEWLQQVRTTSTELRSMGRQIIASLIAEEVARHEHSLATRQIELNRDVNDHLLEKFTNQELYGWLKGETSRLFYEQYKLAADLARRAERAVKQELMDPGLDGTEFISFGHWDAGRKGLMSDIRLLGELRRLEQAYDEHLSRDRTATLQVSLRQLDPVSLMELKVTGSCQVTIPEWFFDIYMPGQYMRRIRRVAFSLDPVLAPQTPVPLTATLMTSSVRKSSLPGGDYRRQEGDDRFVDFVGGGDSVTTSTGIADRGYEPDPGHPGRKEPFEMAGAISTWQLDLPGPLRPFDYGAIGDVTLAITYSFRHGGAPLRASASGVTADILGAAAEAEPVLFASLRHEQPRDWAAFQAGNGDFPFAVDAANFPFWARHAGFALTGEVRVFGMANGRLVTKTVAIPQAEQDRFAAEGRAAVAIPADNQVSPRAARDLWVTVPYQLA